MPKIFPKTELTRADCLTTTVLMVVHVGCVETHLTLTFVFTPGRFERAFLPPTEPLYWFASAEALMASGSP
ncbi:MAG: hypothetical protein ACXVRE_03820 [Gaiellaceae bacterium]